MWVIWKGKAALTALRKIHCIFGVFSIVDGQMAKTRATIDGDIKVALAYHAILGAQLGQMLDVDVDISQVIISERSGAASCLCSLFGWPTIEASILENAPDAVTVQVRQEMPQDKGQIIKAEFGCLAQMANDRPLFLTGFPGKPFGAAGPVATVIDAAFAPFTHRLVADPIPTSQRAGRFRGTSDFLSHGRSCAGLRMNLKHQRALPSWTSNHGA